jgi:hypothetical protein
LTWLCDRLNRFNRYDGSHASADLMKREPTELNAGNIPFAKTVVNFIRLVGWGKANRSETFQPRTQKFLEVRTETQCKFPPERLKCCLKESWSSSLDSTSKNSIWSSTVFTHSLDPNYLFQDGHPKPLVDKLQLQSNGFRSPNKQVPCESHGLSWGKLFVGINESL